MRSVKNTDARIPGDQFFTDTATARLVSIDVTTGVDGVLTPQPIVLRSFQLSPTGRHILYVAPSPETLGIIGKEQNDTFVLTVPPPARARRRRASSPSAAGFRGRPDGERLSFVSGGRLMVLPVEGGEPKPWLEALTLSIGEPAWSPDRSRFATLVADPSVTDPEIEPVKPGMYTTAQPFMDLYIVQADGSSKNLTTGFTDQVSEPGVEPRWHRAVLPRRRQHDLRRDHLPLHRGRRQARADRPRAGVVRAAAGDGAGLVASVEAATRPTDLWLLGAGEQRTRITNLNPQLARFRFSKPELFYFDNADGERLGALLYKPAGLGPNDKVPVITWVYEKMTPARHRFNARDQMFISHGYAMLMPNVKVKVGQTADSFEKCVVPAVNAVRQMGFTNGKFGLWGHSFGAYATSNLITRTSIFAAAVSGATPPELFRNWASGRDRDSRNIETGQARMGGSPFEYPGALLLAIGVLSPRQGARRRC